MGCGPLLGRQTACTNVTANLRSKRPAFHTPSVAFGDTFPASRRRGRPAAACRLDDLCERRSRGPIKASGSHLGCRAAKRTACRTRSRPWDTPCRLGVRGVPSCPAFSLAPALGSTNSSAGRPASFVRFTATQAESDPSTPCVIGFGSSSSRCGPLTSRAAKVEVSRFPFEERTCQGLRPRRTGHALALTRTPVSPSAPDDSVGVPIEFAAQWLAYMHPCRRFAPGLTADGARLGASAVRHSFTAVDWRRLLLAGLPAHCHRNRGSKAADVPRPRVAALFDPQKTAAARSS